MAHFGDRLRELFPGKTQREIGELLNVTDAAVRNYLAGRVPDADKLEQIARLTGCNLHWLLVGEGQRKTDESTEQIVRSLDDILNERVSASLRAMLDNDDAVRDIIRQISLEATAASRKRPIVKIDFGSGADAESLDDTTRKTG